MTEETESVASPGSLPCEGRGGSQGKSSRLKPLPQELSVSSGTTTHRTQHENQSPPPPVIPPAPARRDRPPFPRGPGGRRPARSLPPPGTPPRTGAPPGRPPRPPPPLPPTP